MNVADVVSSGAARPLGDADPLGVFHNLISPVFSLSFFYRND